MASIKSIDPDWPEDDPHKEEMTYEINHFKNLYLLPRSVHELKNTINKYQLFDIKEGETRLIYMAVPDRREGDPAFYKHAKATVTELENPVYSSHVALTMSEYCVGLSEQLIELAHAGNAHGMNDVSDLAESTYSYLSKWYERTLYILAQMDATGEKVNKRCRRELSANREALKQNIDTFFRVFPHLPEEDSAITRDFSSISGINMSIQTPDQQIEATEAVPS